VNGVLDSKALIQNELVHATVIGSCFFYYLTICLKTNTKNYFDIYLCKLIFIDADYKTVVKL